MSLKKNLTAVLDAAFELIEEAPVSQERRRIEIGFEKARVAVAALTCSDEDCEAETRPQAVPFGEMLAKSKAVKAERLNDNAGPESSEGVVEQIENADADSGTSPLE
jgi:hypothetical protein